MALDLIPFAFVMRTGVEGLLIAIEEVVECDKGDDVDEAKAEDDEGLAAEGKLKGEPAEVGKADYSSVFVSDQRVFPNICTDESQLALDGRVEGW